MKHPPAPADHDELLGQLGWMRTLARRLTRDPEVADDVLQRACLLALQRPPEAEGDGAGLRAWLGAVLRRLAGHRRREDARRAHREQVAAAPEALPATIDLAARREILRRLVEALTTLEEPGFSTVVRRYYDGLSTLQIAAQDGVSPEVVRQRLQRARVRLRERLAAQLDPQWLPALALLSPPPRGATLSTLTRPLIRGLLMAERTARPLVWKAAAAGIAVALGAGAWYALGSASDEAPAAPAASLPRLAAATSAPQSLPAPPPARAEPAPVQAASAAPVEPAKVEPPSAPAAPSNEAAWHALWATADATMDGNVRLDDVLDTTQLLLDLAQSRLAAQGLSALADPTAPFVILDEKGVGRATLTLTSSPSDAPEPWHAYTFDVSLDTDDGRYTGLHQGKPDQSRMSIAFSVGADGQPMRCAANLQNIPAGTPELHAYWAGRGPQPDGGVLHVSGEGAEWFPLTVEAVSVDPETGKPLDDISFFHRMGDKTPRPDSLANPRVAPMTQRLAALGPAAPPR